MVCPRCASFCSIVRRWVLVVRSICILLPWCAPFAGSSIAVDYQPFKIITHKYSLSSYIFPALNQLNFSSARPTGLNGHLIIRDSTPTSCQKGSYLHNDSPVIEWIKFNNGLGKQHRNPSIPLQTMCCMLIEWKIMHFHCHDLHWPCPSIRTPAPGIMKLTILVDPSLVIITTYLVCLINACQ